MNHWSILWTFQSPPPHPHPRQKKIHKINHQSTPIKKESGEKTQKKILCSVNKTKGEVITATAEILNDTKRRALRSDEAHETDSEIPYSEFITKPWHVDQATGKGKIQSNKDREILIMNKDYHNPQVGLLLKEEALLQDKHS